MKVKVSSIIVSVVGFLMLIAGIVFLVINLNRGPLVSDGEFLVSGGKWVLDGEEGVVWTFSEIGKGTLTTNGHENDYDFIWAIKDGRILIETDWLYKLENEYEYTLDRNEKVLVLKDGETESRLIAENKTE